MIIRAATAQDAPSVAAIWNHEIREDVSTFNSIEKSETEISALISDRPDTFLVAEMGGQALGFATYSQFRGGIGYLHSMEHTVYLSPSARGQGAGRALMSELESIARKNNVHALIAGIGGENIAGIAFHTAIGFSETGRLPEVGHKFGRWMDLVLMQKNL